MKFPVMHTCLALGFICSKTFFFFFTMPVKQDTNIENKENTTPTLGVLGTNHQF